MWVLFNPTLLLKIFTPILRPLQYSIYVLPLLMLGALMLAFGEAQLLLQDSRQLVETFDFFEHWLLSLFGVNLLVTCTTAVMAFNYRATVSGFGIALVMGFYPRFTLRVSYVQQLSRVERIWLHAAPLLLRLLLFTVCVFAWYLTRHMNNVVPQAAIALGVTAIVGLLIAANPLIKSSGYHLLEAFTNEPHLRGKAFKTLLNKLRGGTFKEANDLLLATYAIAMAVFMFVLIVGAAVVAGTALHQIQLGGSAIIVASVVGIALLRRTMIYFGRVQAAYDRSLQFDRWRKRTHRQEEAPETAAPPKHGAATYVSRAVLLTVFVALFLPYPYRPGGSFIIYPRLQQVITTDVSGRVDEVLFDGGETLQKGTVIARLASTENQAQVDIYTKKMSEQQAVIDDLKARPRPEDVLVAEGALNVEKTRAEFSHSEMNRINKLYKDNIVPLEELEEARRQVAVDQKQVAEKQAALRVAKLGATKYEIAEAEAKLASLQAERDSYLDRVNRSVMVMPFDGRLLTLHLKQKGNAYYQSGEVFAAAEDSGRVTAEIELPESEAAFVKLGATVSLKPNAYSSELFDGTVSLIDWNVTEQTFGNVIKVIVTIDNEDGRLKNGMTGYAKIDGDSLLVWEAFSRAVVRFAQVQVWSWIP